MILSHMHSEKGSQQHNKIITKIDFDCTHVKIGQLMVNLRIHPPSPASLCLNIQQRRALHFRKQKYQE
jgi:hypothetical protein